MSASSQTSSASASATAAPEPERRWLWSLIGGAVGLGDFGVLLAFDANMSVGGHDVTLLMGLLFFLPYSLAGWAIGGLIAARKQAVRDRETITQQIRALERTQRALVQEEKLAGIGRLAAGVAHEVRNPLGVIRASASMAQESFESHTDPHRALGFVCEETDRLDRLIASLLAFAKPQPVECIETDLTKVFDRALELARKDAQDAKVSLQLDVAPGLPPLLADPDRLSQSLYGLTLNAIQAIEESRAGTGRILLRARAHEDLVRIEVLDSGPGIPQARQDEIFEPFFTSKATGTGLGLPMALRMIEAQGGVLRLAAGSGPADFPGAHFVIEFAPYGAPNAAVGAVARAAVPRNPS